LYEAYKTRKNNKEEYVKDLDELAKIGSPDDLLALLDTSLKGGIDKRSHDARVAHFGSNMPKVKPRTTFCELVLDSLEDFMLRLLIVCAIFALITEMAFAKPEALSYAWVEGGGILAAVAFVSLFTAASDYNKETQFLENQKLEHASLEVIVKRNGEEEKIHKDHLLVGDIVKVSAGQGIPVDGMLLTNIGTCMVDESAMTGESDHLPREILSRCQAKQQEHEHDTKDDWNVHAVPTPLLLSGTNLTLADGWMVTLVVGKETCEGQIMAALEGKSKGMKLTPLQIKLNTIAEDIGKLGMFCAILIFHALMARNFIEGMMRYDFDMFGGEQSVTRGSKCSITEKYTIAGTAFDQTELFPSHKEVLKVNK